jgi:hypothetical protein
MLPPGDDDALVRRANSSAFDIASLKNGNQMLASEGVIATVFYRTLAADPSVARYSSLFRALRQMDARSLLPDSPLLPMLAQSWTAADPLRGASFTKILIDTTYGAMALTAAWPTSPAAWVSLRRSPQHFKTWRRQP